MLGLTYISLPRFIILFIVSLFCFTSFRIVPEVSLLVSTSVSPQDWSCLIFYCCWNVFHFVYVWFLIFFFGMLSSFGLDSRYLRLLNCGDFGFCYFSPMSAVSLSGYYLGWNGHVHSVSLMETIMSILVLFVCLLLLICFNSVPHMHVSGASRKYG